jgi:hypothetical protein
MVLLAILTGVVGVFFWRRHIGYIELIVLCSWGLLAATTPMGQVPASWLASLSAQITHWF